MPKYMIERTISETANLSDDLQSIAQQSSLDSPFNSHLPERSNIMKRFILASLSVLALSITANSPAFALNQRFDTAHQSILNKLNQRMDKARQENLNSLNPRFEQERQSTLNA